MPWEGGGCSALNFQRGKTAKASLEVSDRINFPVCKSSSTNQPWSKQDKDQQSNRNSKGSENNQKFQRGGEQFWNSEALGGGGGRVEHFGISKG